MNDTFQKGGGGGGGGGEGYYYFHCFKFCNWLIIDEIHQFHPMAA